MFIEAHTPCDDCQPDQRPLQRGAWLDLVYFLLLLPSSWSSNIDNNRSFCEGLPQPALGFVIESTKPDRRLSLLREQQGSLRGLPLGSSGGNNDRNLKGSVSGHLKS